MVSILVSSNSGKSRTCSSNGYHAKQIGDTDLPITLVDKHPDVRGQIAAKRAILRQPRDDAAQRARSLYCKTGLH